MEGGELFSRIQERADSAFTERGETIFQPIKWLDCVHMVLVYLLFWFNVNNSAQIGWNIILLCPRHDIGLGIKCYPCLFVRTLRTNVRTSRRRPLSKSNTFDQNFMKLGHIV